MVKAIFGALGQNSDTVPLMEATKKVPFLMARPEVFFSKHFLPKLFADLKHPDANNFCSIVFLFLSLGLHKSLYPWKIIKQISFTAKVQKSIKRRIGEKHDFFRLLLIVSRLLLIVSWLLLIVSRLLLTVSRLLLIVSRLLLIVSRLLLIVSQLLLIVSRLLLIVSRLLLIVSLMCFPVSFYIVKRVPVTFNCVPVTFSKCPVKKKAADTIKVTGTH